MKFEGLHAPRLNVSCWCLHAGLSARHSLWVIFDRFSRFWLPLHVSFSPKAPQLHCGKMTRCATNYKWPEKTADAPPPGTAL
jgi:hypothetical protein